MTDVFKQRICAHVLDNHFAFNKAFGQKTGRSTEETDSK